MTKDLDSGFGPEDVNLIGRQTVYQGFVRVDKSRLRHRKFNGSWSEPIDREIVCKHDAVGILVYDPSLDSVCLVQPVSSTTDGTFGISLDFGVGCWLD